MADPCDAETLLVSVTHGGTALGIAIGFSYEHSVQDVVIRDEGVTGPSCRGVIQQDLSASCEFLVAPPIAADTGPSSLVITTKKANGNTRTHTLAYMKSRGSSQQMNRDAPPAVFTQQFVLVSDTVSVVHG
jgi:hypothetical protein